MDAGLHLSKHGKVWSTPGLRNQAAAVIIYSLSLASVMPENLTSLLALDSTLESELIEQQICKESTTFFQSAKN